MHWLMIGCSHHRTPLELREEVGLSDAQGLRSSGSVQPKVAGGRGSAAQYVQSRRVLCRWRKSRFATDQRFRQSVFGPLPWPGSQRHCTPTDRTPRRSSD